MSKRELEEWIKEHPLPIPQESFEDSWGIENPNGFSLWDEQEQLCSSNEHQEVQTISLIAEETEEEQEG